MKSPLRFGHFGELQTFGGEVFDMRAEVGLLTRNVVIQGDSVSTAKQFGATVMMHSPVSLSQIP